MEKEQWGPRLVAVVAGEIRRYRTDRHLSTQQLSERCADLGWPIKRSVLSNLELGYRETVTVPEVLVIAKALGVPPALLLFPVGREKLVEVLPGQCIGTWAAAKWFSGQEPFLTKRDDGDGWATTGADRDSWRESAIVYFMDQDAMLEEWSDWRRRADDARKQAAAVTGPDMRSSYLRLAESAEASMRQVEAQLREHRKAMRAADLDPGKLDSVLHHVEDDTGADTSTH